MSLFFLKEKNQKAGGSLSWSNQELAEFYRILDIMKTSGLSIDWERGLSDEGEPWAVFLRPETGEVIAHFARIDAVFIAVSSANNKLYRGENIRSVVNQMLQSSHLLLPTTPNSSNVYLHPGVVLTAFVVASYLLVTDEVRAVDYEKIVSTEESIVNFTSSTYTNANKVPLTSNSGRAVTLEEVSLQNQAVLLGAVMLAYSISPVLKPGSDGGWKLWGEANLVNMIPLGDENKAQPKNEIANNRHEDALHVENEVKLIDFGVGKSSKAQTSSGAAKKTQLWDDVGSFSPFFVPSLEVEDDVSGVNGGRVNTSFSFSVNMVKGDIASVKTQGQIGNKQLVAAIEQQETYQTSTDFTNLPELLNIVKQAFTKAEQGNSSEQTLPLEILGVMVEADGKYFVMGISEDRQSIQTKTSKEDQGITDFSVVETEKENVILSESVSPKDIKTDLILGHQLNEDHPSHLVLSDATDVVFYSGGHKHVQHFELGKDLLWFFLSPQQIDQTYSQVLNKSDVMISFGDFDTLTLIDVIDTNAVEILL